MSGLISNWYRGPVTALCPALQQTHVLVGRGQFVSLHQLDDDCHRGQCQVFRASVVHHIELLRRDDSEELFIVRGGKSVATVKINADNCLEIVDTETVHDDWIISSRVSGDNIWLLSAHNKLHQHGTSGDQGRPGPGGPCILYSGFLHCRPSSDHVIVMAGTVFGRVLIWDSGTGDMINSLEGHDGVIFSVNYSHGVIVTTSDDRSSIVYRVTGDNLAMVEQVARVYGHTARVFRSLIMGGTVTTAGEDSTHGTVTTAGEDGTHGTVTTAGEDGRVITWCLDTGAELDRQEPHGGSAVWSVAMVDSCHLVTGGGDGSVTVSAMTTDTDSATAGLPLTEGKPRIVKCHEDRVLVMDDRGSLYSYNPEHNSMTKVFSDSRLASYCLLELHCDVIVMCGLTGVVVIGVMSGDTIDPLVSREVVTGKIFSCGVVSSDGAVIVCDGQGRLTMVDSALQTLAIGQLPTMRDPWFTASSYLGEIIVLGDRCGGVHFTKRTGDQLVIVRSYDRVHGRHGVTSLTVDSGVVWSSGRDGVVRCYTVTHGASGDHDEHVSYDVSDNGDHDHEHSDHDHVSVNMVQSVRMAQDWVASVRSLYGQLLVVLWHGSVLSITYLGSHSPLASVECGGGHRSWDIAGDKVVYIKEGQVMMEPLATNKKHMLTPGGHTQQINVVKICYNFIITGGEDTNIRVFYDRDHEEIAVLRGHLSSIKCLDIVNVVHDGDNDGSEMILVSGGGRAELRLWKLVMTSNHHLFCSPLHSVMVREGGGGRGNKKAWRAAQAERRLDAETRFMSVASAWESRDCLRVYVACSDSCVRVYCYDKTADSVTLVREASHHDHCLLQLRLVPDTDLLATGNTGGMLTMWSRDTLALVTQLRVHQSGVNCLDIASDRRHGLIIATGGDDTLLKVTRYSDGQLTPLWSSDYTRGHTTQITGLRIHGGDIVTAGVDQRLIVWSYHTGELKWRFSKLVSVADISDIDCQEVYRDYYNIVVAGVGLQRLSRT